MSSKRIKFEIKNGWLPQISCEYRPGFKVGSSGCAACRYRDRKNDMFRDMFVYCAYEDKIRDEEVKEYWR